MVYMGSKATLICGSNFLFFAHFSGGFVLVSKKNFILLINRVEKSFRAKKKKKVTKDFCGKQLTSRVKTECAQININGSQ